MSRIRRLLRWLFFLGCLSAIATGVFWFVRHSPRSVIEGRFLSQFPSPDGSQVVTFAQPEPNSLRIQLWDVRTSDVIHESLLRLQNEAAIDLTTDQRYLARCGHDAVWLCDLRSGQDGPIDETHGLSLQKLKFSATGCWLVVCCELASHIVDVATRKVVLVSQDSEPRFSGDDRLLLERRPDGGGLGVRNLENGQVLGTLPITPADFCPLQFSADGRLLLVKLESDRSRVGEDALDDTYRLEVWDLATCRRRFRGGITRANLQATFSPDSRHLALWEDDVVRTWPVVSQGSSPKSDVTALPVLELIETKSGRTLWSCAMKSARACVFSPDDALVYLAHGQHKHTLTMFDVRTGRVLWERPFGQAGFVKNSGLLMYHDATTMALQFLDARTGIQIAAAPANTQWLASSHMNSTSSTADSELKSELTPDGRLAAVQGFLAADPELPSWRQWLAKQWPAVFGKDAACASVMETATGQELLRITNRSPQVLHLAADGDTLITIGVKDEGSETVVIRAYDVAPTRAWLWAIGVCVGAGLAWLVLTRGWRVWRKQRGARKVARSTLP